MAKAPKQNVKGRKTKGIPQPSNKGLGPKTPKNL